MFQTELEGTSGFVAVLCVAIFRTAFWDIPADTGCTFEVDCTLPVGGMPVADAVRGSFAAWPLLVGFVEYTTGNTCCLESGVSAATATAVCSAATPLVGGGGIWTGVSSGVVVAVGFCAIANCVGLSVPVAEPAVGLEVRLVLSGDRQASCEAAPGLTPLDAVNAFEPCGTSG